MMDQDRFLSPEEIELLMRFTISAESFWDVLIFTRDKRFSTEVRNIFLDDDRVRIRTAETGCDALISCVRGIPDLLILDTGPTDVSPPDLISSLRRDPELKSIKILCRVKEYPHTGNPEWGADDYLRDDDVDVDKIYLLRKMHTLLYSSSMHHESCRTESHERHWPRTKLNVTARITVSHPDTPERMEYGQAVVENISLGGAYLSEIRLESGMMPCGTGAITLHINQPALRNWHADSLVVHQAPEGAAGVRFVNISRYHRLKIAELFCK